MSRFTRLHFNYKNALYRSRKWHCPYLPAFQGSCQALSGVVSHCSVQGLFLTVFHPNRQSRTPLLLTSHEQGRQGLVFWEAKSEKTA